MHTTDGETDPAVGREFVEIEWADSHVEARWANRRMEIDWLWRELEWRSVAAGVRSAAVRTVTDTSLSRMSRVVAEHGLALVPLARVARAGYRARLIPAKTDEANATVSVIAAPEAAAEFAELWKASAHMEIGARLGYPACCREFFRQVWFDRRHIDTTWEMACGTANGAAAGDGDRRTVSGPWQTNVLLRWLGIRAVPHLPCRCDCSASVAFAHELLRTETSARGQEAARTLEDVLSMPLTWTSVGGVAEIRAPIVRIRASSDHLVGRHEVAWTRSN